MNHRVHPHADRRFVVVDDPRWRHSHASTLLSQPDGSLLTAWFAGTAEGAADTAIWLARREPDETVWGIPTVVLDADVAHWNPVLAHGPDRTTWLFAKRGPHISTWSTWVLTSTDQGRTWGDPRELVPGDQGGRGPARNPPLMLPDGTWLAPSSTEVWHPRPRWDAFVDRSTDGGSTWTAVPIPLDHDGLTGAGVIQPALWSSGERVLALLRSSEGTAYRSVSDDRGITWSQAQPSSLPNNNSGLAVLALDDGTVVCAHNPTSGDWAARCPLVLSVSTEDGRSWHESVVVEDGATPVDEHADRVPSLPVPGAFAPADGGVATAGVGEYSYPALTRTGDHLTITYTWQRRGIVEATVPVTQLRRESTP